MSTRYKVRQALSEPRSSSTNDRSFTTRIFSAVILMLLLTINAPVSTPLKAYSGPEVQTASTLTFTAEADAYVQEAQPTANTGTANFFEVDNGTNNDKESYVRFTISGVSGPIQNARLRVYSTTNSNNGPAAYAASNTWTETGITWNNRPARTGGALDNKGSIRKNTWTEYTVTPQITGNGTYTFALITDNTDGIHFTSREGNNDPQLLITFISSTNTPTATATSSLTPTPTSTATSTSTATQLPSSTPTYTPSVTQAFSETPTNTPTNTPTITPTITPSPTATFTGTSTLASSLFTFTPSADSYVNSGSPATNYGSLTSFRADGSPTVRSYLRFNVQGLSGTVTRATLRVFANSAATSGYEIRGVSNNTWVESTITYNNAPAVGTVLDTSGSFGAGVWTTVDITTYITGNGTYNLGLTTPGSTAISFASREVGNNAPQLIIETQGGTTATPISTGTATPTASRTSTPNPTAVGSVVLVGAGDIANCSRTQDELTAQLLDNIPGTVFTAGDNAYIDGTYTEYLNCYDPTWGRHKSRTQPSPGNHEYLTSGAAGYFQYFNNIPSYYAYDLGSWRIYSLNSEISVSATSAQVTWLQDDLAANPSQCVLAYWHKPRWSSGSNHGNSSTMQTLWQVLHDAGAELVINGHEHNYERFSEMNAAGTAVSQGLREIVVGTGGAALYPFGSPLSTSQVRSNSSYGVLKLTLDASGYDWQFVPAAGSTFTDSGSDTCH